MRASILVLGPLLARCGEARVSLPGGCAIGARPVDLHLKGLEQMGAAIALEGGYVNAAAPAGLQGADIVCPFVSVGATENLLMAATLADGRTVLANAAREPEITDLAHCLIAMGAAHRPASAPAPLCIEGVRELHGATTRSSPTASRPAPTPAPRPSPAAALNWSAPASTTSPPSRQRWTKPASRSRQGGRHPACAASTACTAPTCMTEPYPGFPTDMQAQFMALMCVAEGAAMLTETIFENRFMHVPELNRMGARINVHGAAPSSAASPTCQGAQVMATDLRASASLVLAGLAARGRDDRQPRLSPGPRLRGDRAPARRLRRRYRAPERLRRRRVSNGVRHKPDTIPRDSGPTMLNGSFT